MPTIKYPKNPNTDTAFVEQDDGTKNRALMIAPQDISTLELPKNANSCKGYVTVDGKKQRVILTADIGGGSGSSLPDQTGHAGEFLTTDGTDASWSDKPLVNQTTNTNALAIGAGSSCLTMESTAVGALSVGYGRYGTALGKSSTAKYKATALGANTTANDYTIQLGQGGTNSDAGTMKVALTTSSDVTTNYELMSADGTVPHARLTNAVVSNSITIAVADWNGGTTCTKTISGLTATSVVWVAPDNASQSDYLTAGVYASNQTADTLEFTCTTTPTSALTVNVIYC